MKTLRYTLITLVSLLGLTCCTHNEGDIGIWFGTWQVEDIECAELNLEETYYDPATAPIYFQFQGEMVTVRMVNKLHDERVDYGTWSEGDGTLDISFPDNNVAYDQFLSSLLGGNESCTFHFVITEQSAQSMTLSFFNTIWEQHWTLKLKKL